MKLLYLAFVALVLVGCVSTNPYHAEVIETSNYAITPSVHDEYKEFIHTDKLENVFYYRGYDYNSMLLGSTYSKIYFSHFPGTDYIRARFNTMQLDWVFADNVSVYVKSEKLIDKEGENTSRDTRAVDGGYSTSVYTFEYFDVNIDIETARKIAFADSGDITIRFHSPNGYVDETIHPMASLKGLKAVVELASATSEKI